MPSTVLTCIVLILTKSVTTMLAIMVTLKVVMILTRGRYATTALSVIGTVKSLGGVALTNVAGRLADAAGLQTMFTVLLAISAATLLLGLLIRVPDDGKTFFAGEE